MATEEQIFGITLDEALKIYAEPKRRGRQGVAAPPLRELGNDPASGKPMVIKDGRFGPYVTDGETNASLRKGDDVLSITDDRAAELLAERRARGPVKKVAKKTVQGSGPQSGQEGRQEVLKALPRGAAVVVTTGRQRSLDRQSGPVGREPGGCVERSVRQKSQRDISGRSVGTARFSGRASCVGAVRPRRSTISPTFQHSASASSAPLTAIAEAST